VDPDLHYFRIEDPDPGPYFKNVKIFSTLQDKRIRIRIRSVFVDLLNLDQDSDPHLREILDLDLQSWLL